MVTELTQTDANRYHNRTKELRFSYVESLELSRAYRLLKGLLLCSSLRITLFILVNNEANYYSHQMYGFHEKTDRAALRCYECYSLLSSFFFFNVCSKKQSAQQVGALTLLIIAAILLSAGEGSSKGSGGKNTDIVFLYGIVPVMVASVLSGLASSLCQWASQVRFSLSLTGGEKKGSFLVCNFLSTIIVPSSFTGKETHVIFDDYRNVSCWKSLFVSKLVQVSRWGEY